MITGFPFKASLFKDSGLPICKTTNIKNGMVSVDTVDFFDPADYNDDFKRYEIKKFDIVIGMSGSIKVGMNRGDQVLYLNQRVGKFLPDESKVLNGYLYYVLINSVELLANNIGGGSVKNLSNRDVLDFSIPLPPLAEQERIVAILDRFDSLCNSLTEGLPAEIELRKKQYEYYRDKLLAFSGELRVES